MAKKNDWDVFWKQAWRNLFHMLGMVAVLAAIIGAGVLVWMSFLYSSPSTSSDSERKAQRELFQKVVMQAPQPCAEKKAGAKFSNLEGCTLFRLRPGMQPSEMLSIINSSGYFENRAEFRDPILAKEYCSKNKDKEDKYDMCKYYISISNQTFKISIRFDDRGYAKKVALIFSHAHPYSDLKNIRAILIKLIGPPDDSSLSDHDTWGDEANGKWSIRAYTYEDNFWVIFEARPEKKESDATVTK